MKRYFAAFCVALLVCTTTQGGEIRGQYVEARTCDVWTGPCFANADFNIGGKNGVMGWKIDKGSMDNVRLDGLGVVAVVAAGNTLGLEQSGPARAILIVDCRATSLQREALVKFAKEQGGKLLGNILAVQDAKVELTNCQCDGEACYELVAGAARVKTRCIDHKADQACGNETAFYPPLARGVSARVAGVVEHSFRGQGLEENWGDFERRGAYVGSFQVK
ncbi:MAG: DUF1326 domain-containing protein [Planctomycetes bacterium]|nr:DUF1326 domain-containing protein [Planctomycetota bacterium]